MYVFKAREYFGQPRETEEMKPRWFSTDKIPFKKMWSDDPYWLPYFLADQKFKGKFIFDSRDRIISYQLKKVDKL